MFSFSQQLTHAGKAVLETQLASAEAFAGTAFDSGVTAIELNVDALKTALAAATVATRQLMDVKTPQEWFSALAKQSQLALERGASYGRQANEIAKGAQTAFSGVARTEMASAKESVGSLVDVVKNTASVVATPINSFLKTAFDGVHAGYDKNARPGQAVAAEPTALDAAGAPA